jgi:uncharacterized protein (DUF1684 family)
MKKLALYALLFALIGCAQNKKEEAASAEYEKEINTWHEKRISDLKADNGWLNLVGLHWLNAGINTFGSSEKNDIVFPEGTIAEEAGYFLLKDGQVTILVNKEATVSIGQKAITKEVIFHPDSAHAPLVESGSLRWNIIKREDKLGIRLRDLASEAVQNFKGIDRFPINPDYKLIGQFEKGDSSRTIDVTNVLGQTTAQYSPGRVTFEWEGKDYHLDVLDGKDEFFIVFADATSGKETYGSGRFLYISKPGADGVVTIDFNKAYNPPCAFTPYATCPLPPKQNILSVEINAGEKNYGEAHALPTKS